MVNMAINIALAWAFFGSLIFLLDSHNPRFEFYVYALWPIALIKYLLLGLFKILFTDWKL